MKIIKSQAALEQEVRDKNQLIAQLEEQLRQATGKSPTPKVRRPPRIPVLRKKELRWEDPEPEHPPFPSLSTTDYSQLVYGDGKLIDTEIRNKNYLRHTETSSRKTTDEYRARRDGVAWTTIKREDESRWEEAERREALGGHGRWLEDIQKEPPKEFLKGTCGQCKKKGYPTGTDDSASSTGTPTDEGYSEGTDDSESSTTPPAGEPTEKTPTAPPVWYIRIPYEEQMAVMEKAHDLARQGIWEAVRSHWPKDQLRCFPEHWKQVRFGREDLERTGFGTKEYPSPLTELCDQTRHTIYHAMDSIISLRNAICHPGGGRTLRGLHSMISDVRHLLELLKDEERIAAFDGLYDEAEDSARKVYADIEARELLAGQPEAVPWPVNVQFLLEDVAYYETLGLPKKPEYPGFMVRAARNWKAKGFQPGEDFLQ